MFSIRAWGMPPAVILGAAVISVAMVGLVTSGRLPGLATSSVPVSASRESEEATTSVTESGETEAHVEGQGRRDGSGGGRGLLTKEADPTILITESAGWIGLPAAATLVAWWGFNAIAPAGRRATRQTVR